MLGRRAARSGRFDEGIELLRTAREQGATAEVVETDARIAGALGARPPKTDFGWQPMP